MNLPFNDFVLLVLPIRDRPLLLRNLATLTCRRKARITCQKTSVGNGDQQGTYSGKTGTRALGATLGKHKNLANQNMAV